MENLSNEFPLCQSWQDYICMVKTMSLEIDMASELCPKYCSIFEYEGRLKNDIQSYYVEGFTWSYDISNNTQINEQYLVYDFAGFLGSVGGTIGLFIGFSFYDTLVIIINYLRKIISRK